MNIKSIKSSYTFISLFLISLLFLTACGGGSSNSAPPPPPPPPTTYTVSVDVIDLNSVISGSNLLVLQNNGGDDLSLSAGGTSSFTTSLSDGANYDVTVLSQPTGANCAVTNGSGVVAGANVNISVDCVAVTYSVGGTLTGLDASQAITLQNNGIDDLTLSADGAFNFVTPIIDGTSFNITVSVQPIGQVCTVSNGNGAVSGADDSNASVNCVTGAINISGSAIDDNDNGLAGVTIEARSATDDSVLSTTTSGGANGNFSIAVMPSQDFYLHANGGVVASINYYSINLQIQNETADRSGIQFFMTPTAIVDSVVASGAIGSVTLNTDAVFFLEFIDANDFGVAGISVTSTPTIANIWYDQDGAGTYSLTGPSTTNTTPAVLGYVVNPGANATYAFSLTGNTSAIGIDTNLSLRMIPGELSAPIEGVGSLQSYTISTTVTDPTTALSGGNQLILENNGGDALTIDAAGTYTFSTSVVSGGSYVVSVATQPVGVTCTASNNTGTIANANITDVAVSCDSSVLAIGGTVTGLASNESLVLQNNGVDDLNVAADGGFTFASLMANGAGYNVTVSTQPVTQSCSVTNGTGTATTAAGDVTDIVINCSNNTFSVSGMVSGLVSNASVVLQNNGLDNETVSANGSFNFLTAVADGAGYAVTVLTQPVGQNCVVTNGSGVISSSNVTNVSVVCSNINLTMSGEVLNDIDLGVAGITVQAKNAVTDAVLASTVTDGSGVYTISVQANQDFYLHQVGGVVSGINYYPINLQIQNEQSDRVNLRFFAIPTVDIQDFLAASNIGASINITTDALFSIEICNNPCETDTGVAGISVATTPNIATLYYDQDGNGTYSLTGPTTIFNGSAVIGNVSNISSNGTYQFILTGPTANLGIGASFKLRLIAGEFSTPIED